MHAASSAAPSLYAWMLAHVLLQSLPNGASCHAPCSSLINSSRRWVWWYHYAISLHVGSRICLPQRTHTHTITNSAGAAPRWRTEPLAVVLCSMLGDRCNMGRNGIKMQGLKGVKGTPVTFAAGCAVRERSAPNEKCIYNSTIDIEQNPELKMNRICPFQHNLNSPVGKRVSYGVRKLSKYKPRNFVHS